MTAKHHLETFAAAIGIAAWWKGLPATWKSVLILGLAFSTGAGLTTAAHQFVGLPEIVEENSRQIGRLSQDIETLRQEMRFATCTNLMQQQPGLDLRQCMRTHQFLFDDAEPLGE